MTAVPVASWSRLCSSRPWMSQDFRRKLNQAEKPTTGRRSATFLARFIALITAGRRLRRLAGDSGGDWGDPQTWWFWGALSPRVGRYGLSPTSTCAKPCRRFSSSSAALALGTRSPASSLALIQNPALLVAGIAPRTIGFHHSSEQRERCAGAASRTASCRGCGPLISRLWQRLLGPLLHQKACSIGRDPFPPCQRHESGPLASGPSRPEGLVAGNEPAIPPAPAHFQPSLSADA